MTEYMASNGYRIVIRGNDWMDMFDDDGDRTEWKPERVNALREYFQAERDNELGRWRWPEGPEWVVFPPIERQGALALNESTGERGCLARWEVDLLTPATDTITQALAAYFDANPEPDRPWERAEEGDVWALTFHDKESSWFVNGRYFQSTRTLTNILPTDKSITAGRPLFTEATA